jgi:hypothetical protein
VPPPKAKVSEWGIPGARLKFGRKGGPKLQVNQNHPGATVRDEAQITERRPGLTINRVTGGYLAGGTFSFDPSLTKASFAPVAPFSGSATYRGLHPPRGTHVAHGTWRGNLTVDFPGHADVPLTGPGFKPRSSAQIAPNPAAEPLPWGREPRAW